MSRPRWLPMVAIGLALLARPVGAQTSSVGAPCGPSAARTTLSGIYTKEQAGRGKDVYLSSCTSCHVPASHTGATFKQWWGDKPLADLFTFVATRMPKNDPGSLAPEDVADVVAYLLSINAMPAGRAELPPDVDSLEAIRIALAPPRSARKSTRKRKKP